MGRVKERENRVCERGGGCKKFGEREERKGVRECWEVDRESGKGQREIGKGDIYLTTALLWFQKQINITKIK